jgi:hypothetical protein
VFWSDAYQLGSGALRKKKLNFNYFKRQLQVKVWEIRLKKIYLVEAAGIEPASKGCDLGTLHA